MSDQYQTRVALFSLMARKAAPSITTTHASTVLTPETCPLWLCRSDRVAEERMNILCFQQQSRVVSSPYRVFHV